MAGWLRPPDPIQDKKIRLRGNSAGCRYTTDIICGPLRQEIKGRMPGRDRQSNKGRESEVERGRRERGKREREWRLCYESPGAGKGS